MLLSLLWSYDFQIDNMSHLDQVSITSCLVKVSYLVMTYFLIFSSSKKKEIGRCHAPFYRAWEVQVPAKPGSVTTTLTQAASYSPDLLWTVIETDTQKSNTTQGTSFREDKTPLSLVVNSVTWQWCNNNQKAAPSASLKSTTIIKDKGSEAILNIVSYQFVSLKVVTGQKMAC